MVTSAETSDTEVCVFRLATVQVLQGRFLRGLIGKLYEKANSSGICLSYVLTTNLVSYVSPKNLLIVDTVSVYNKFLI